MFTGGYGYCKHCQYKKYDTMDSNIWEFKAHPNMTVIVNKRRHACKKCNESAKDEKRGRKKKGLGLKKPTGEKAIFDEIWGDRLHRSFVSGKNLDKFAKDDRYYSLFMHVLPKGKYPKFRLKKENIVLGTPWEHILFDQGTVEQRHEYALRNNISWKPLYELRDSLIEEYSELDQ